jgi:hypothetical protein
MASRTSSRQDEEVEEVDEVDEDVAPDEEQQDGQRGGSLSITVEEEMLVIELPRDGNEADTLQRLAKFADGL